MLRGDRIRQQRVRRRRRGDPGGPAGHGAGGGLLVSRALRPGLRTDPGRAAAGVAGPPPRPIPRFLRKISGNAGINCEKPLALSELLWYAFHVSVVDQSGLFRSALFLDLI